LAKAVVAAVVPALARDAAKIGAEEALMPEERLSRRLEHFPSGST